MILNSLQKNRAIENYFLSLLFLMACLKILAKDIKLYSPGQGSNDNTWSQ